MEITLPPNTAPFYNMTTLKFNPTYIRNIAFFTAINHNNYYYEDNQRTLKNNMDRNLPSQSTDVTF